MIEHGTGGDLFARLGAACPESVAAFERSRPIKPGLLTYQALALFILARRYNRSDARILELGSAVGYSASLIAQGAPLAQVTTCNPRVGEIPLLRQNLQPFPNVEVLVRYSWDHLAQAPPDQALDLIFVDGDHNAIARDLPWFNRLAPGGLFLCHDYTPIGSKKPSPVVYATLNAMAAALGRPFDVSVIDAGQVGMVGFVRQPGEVWR